MNIRLTKEQTSQLEQLIGLARDNGHQIAAVNHRFDAYCPTDGIQYPNYDEAFERMKEGSKSVGIPRGYRSQHTETVIGSKDEWAKKYSDVDTLAAASYLVKWVSLDKEILSSDEAGEESGICNEFGIWYDELPLSEEVKPKSDPLDDEAKKWMLESMGE